MEKLYRRLALLKIVLWGITGVCLILAMSNLLSFPWFSQVPKILGILSILFGGILSFFQRAHLLPLFKASLLLLFWLGLCFVLFILINPRQFHIEYPSPQGTHVIVQETDFLDRPAYYLKWGIFMKPVFSLQNQSAPDETLFCRLEWVDENSFRIYDYYDENVYFISL